MKRTLIIKKMSAFFAALVFACFSVWAQEASGLGENSLAESAAEPVLSSVPENEASSGSGSGTPVSGKSDSEKKEVNVAGTAGFNFTWLGFAFKGSVEINELEIGLEIPLAARSYSESSEDISLNAFGLGFSPFIGWVDKPKRSGWQNRIGGMYSYYLPGYINASSLNGMNFAGSGLHMASMYYNGTIKFNRTIGLEIVTRLPFVIASSGGFITAFDTTYGWACWVAMFASTGVGLKFEF